MLQCEYIFRENKTTENKMAVVVKKDCWKVTIIYTDVEKMLGKDQI